MTDPSTLMLVAAVMLLAGTVKGVVGLGLPTVTLALLTATLGLVEAMVILVVPSAVTNFWQMVSGGRLLDLSRRLWPFLALLVLGCLVAGAVVPLVPTGALTVLLGVSTLAYAAVGLTTPGLPRPGRHERWLGPAAGTATGILTGLTGSFVMPSVPYLQALDLPRDALVQAMGLTFFVATVALGLSLGRLGLVPGDLALVSGLSVLPALVGMRLGQALRSRLSPAAFRRALFVALLAVGGWIALKPLVLAVAGT